MTEPEEVKPRRQRTRQEVQRLVICHNFSRYFPCPVRFYAPGESLIFDAGSSSLQFTSFAGRIGITSSIIAVVPAFSQTSVAKFCKRSHSQEPQILETEDAIFPI